MMDEREFDAIEAGSPYLNQRRRSMAEIDALRVQPGSVLEFLERAKKLLTESA